MAWTAAKPWDIKSDNLGFLIHYFLYERLVTTNAFQISLPRKLITIVS